MNRIIIPIERNERLIMYQEALKYLDRSEKNKFYHGFCYIFYMVGSEVFGQPITIERLPELMAYKPGHLDTLSIFWFPAEDWRRRRDILVEIIDHMERENLSRKVGKYLSFTWILALCCLVLSIMFNVVVGYTVIGFIVITLAVVIISPFYRNS